MKSKRTYKIIACVSIWLTVIIAFFGLAIAKPKAGVIINDQAIWTTTTNNTWNSYNQIDNSFYWAIDYARLNVNNGFSIIELSYNDGATTRALNIYVQNISLLYPAILNVRFRPYLVGTQQAYEYFNMPAEIITLSNNDVYIKLEFKGLIDYINNYLSPSGGSINYPMTFPASSNYHGQALVRTGGATISQVDNIYNLQQNDLALIYISDISGLSATMTNEITINWGYIDANDNEVFSVYAPKIGAQLIETDDLLIKLQVPTDAAGTTSNTYDISQQAILSLGTGSATATAHIYGIYVWIQSSRIQWGLAEFDTTGTPASGRSMNYITSLTSLYDYAASNTQTMTCRLSISDNFNFITIKNQPILSANNINTVIQQGGFLPAWSLYNWARGSASGYISGEQAGAAPYQPGNTGYQEIFEAGRQAGISESVGSVNWFVEAMGAVDSMLNIRIFPNITIGYLVGIPFVIEVVWFIIRMFRGGGSSD